MFLSALVNLVNDADGTSAEAYRGRENIDDEKIY
jgi:hypothetical protein